MASAIDHGFGVIVDLLSAFLFYKVPIIQFPLILTVLAAGGVFFTLRYGFVNVRLFKHAIDVLRGKYDDPSHPGEISHFQALSSALSATVGLGNIAGVAVAIQLGGPGAVFWLWVVAFFGMSMKLSSCTFGQLYRAIDSDGRVIGGPMVYLTKAFKEKRMPKVGMALGGFSAFATIMGSFGGGNLFQGNQTFELLANQFPFLGERPLLVGIGLSVLTGIVVLGGIKRIANVTSKLVPFMCGLYVLCCLAIIFGHFSIMPELFADIFRQAFRPDSIYAGGFIGVLTQGVRRGAFSNEAGVGSAAIAHSAAKTDRPVREGVVAMLGPFIDTIVVCTMTALAILATKANELPGLEGMGAQVTAKAFESLGPAMPYFLTLATFIFAYSTMIAYSYYMESAVRFLFGEKFVAPFKVAFIIAAALGPLLKLGKVIAFADLMLLSMALPNIIGMAVLSGTIAKLIKDYVKEFRSGEMKVSISSSKE